MGSRFPSAQFVLENFEIRARRNRDGNRRGLIGPVRRGAICKRLKEFETRLNETICSGCE